MKKYTWIFIIVLLANLKSYSQLSSPTTLGSGANQIKFAEVDNTPSDIIFEISPSSSNSIMRLNVYPSGNSSAFFALANSGDRANTSFARLGVRSNFGVLGTYDLGTPLTSVKNFAIELDPGNVQTGEAFIVTSGGFVGSNYGDEEKIWLKVNENGLETFEVTIVPSVEAPDYVFEEDYDLLPLYKLEAYIQQYKHLPGIPSAKEFEESGIHVGQMNFNLLQKIEELTLYVINLQKENETLKRKEAAETAALKAEIEELKQLVQTTKKIR